jgi:hypothetical protein
VIAVEEEYDKREVSVKDAYEILELVYFGVIVSFLPGKLACFKGESPSDFVWLVHED